MQHLTTGKYLTTREIRSRFIDYFSQQDHTIINSSPLIPQNDPSLMFVNSGMVQFKNIFTGTKSVDYKRAVSSQKCVRAGGKHNDLENVGYTARHHTFFEMLGNFSFGDYFKEQAIFYAWELITKEYGLDKDRLYVTVYHNDDEAIKFWKKISGFNDDRIIRISTNDNFWSMGATGPCGPCSEIFYDHGSHIKGGLPGTPDGDGDRYIEIWNLVFMQYEQIDENTRIQLPKQSVDTGMGLERISAVLQGVHDNYDIDIFKDIMLYAQDILGVKMTDENIASYKVIADHLRSSAFLIADGVMPSNEGRGYVLRRIMRRAMRHIHQMGAKESVMYKLVSKLSSIFAEVYPEINRAYDLIGDTLYQEEERFRSTLERGLKMLNDASQGLAKGDLLSGDVVFKLYDTYGFPLDLTADILKDKKIKIDQSGFDDCMREQKERARKAWVGSGDSANDDNWFKIDNEFGATEFLGYSLDDSEGKIVAIIKDNHLVDSILCDDIHNSDSNSEFVIVTNQTPFYGESGGQMGDIGYIKSDSYILRVTNTLKYLGKIHAHICKIVRYGDNLSDGGCSNNDNYHYFGNSIISSSGSSSSDSSANVDGTNNDAIVNKTTINAADAAIVNKISLDNIIVAAGSKIAISVGDLVHLAIDKDHRTYLRMHHSATHLLHAVMREVLGHHITQKGSLVAADRLRFDVSHSKAVTKEELRTIEDKMNEIIIGNSKVNTKIMSVDDAMNKGAMALFGEKYDSEVRVVSMGSMMNDKHDSQHCRHYSFELCGGTHVSRTGDIGLIKITGESAIAAGIRRIEAVCGKYAIQEIYRNENLLFDIKNLFKATNLDLWDKVSNLLTEKKSLEQKLLNFQINSLMISKEDYHKVTDSIIANSVGEIRFLYRVLDNMESKILRSAAEKLTNIFDNLIAVFVSQSEKKLSLIVGISKNITADTTEIDSSSKDGTKFYHAGSLIQQICKFIDASGSGKSTIAQAGGNADSADLSDLKNKIMQLL